MVPLYDALITVPTWTKAPGGSPGSQLVAGVDGIVFTISSVESNYSSDTDGMYAMSLFSILNSASQPGLSSPSSARHRLFRYSAYAGEDIRGVGVTISNERREQVSGLTNWWRLFRSVKYETINAQQLIAGTNTFEFYLTGYPGEPSRTVTITGVQAYTPPAISNAEIARCDAAGNITNVGRYLKVRAAYSYTGLGGTNTVAPTFRWGIQYGTLSGNIALPGSNQWSAPVGDGKILPNSAYVATVTVKDTIGNTATSDLFAASFTYSPPSISAFEIARCNSSGAITDGGAYLKARGTWTYSDVGGSNSVTSTFTWNVSGGTASAAITLPQGSAWTAPFGGNISPRSYYNATATVTDTAGNTATRSASLSALSYSAPAISAMEIVRCDYSGVSTMTGTYLKVRATWTYTSFDGRNQATATFKWNVSGGTASAAIALPGSNQWSAPIAGISQIKAYTATVTVTDLFSGSASKTETLASIGYSAPAITTLEFVRCDPAGTENEGGFYLKCRAAWTYASVGGTNSAAGAFRWGEQGGGLSEEITLPGSNQWSAPVGGAISPVVAYTASATVTDTFSGIDTRTVHLPALPYSPPAITNADIARDGDYLIVRATWIFTPLAGRNSATGGFAWGEQGGAMSSIVALENGVWSGQEGPILQQGRYIAVVTVDDAFGGSATRTILLSYAEIEMPDVEQYWGLISTQRSGSDYKFTQPIGFNILFLEPVTINGLHFVFNVFDDSYCNDMTVELILDGGVSGGAVPLSPDTASYYYGMQQSDVREIRAVFNGMNKEDRFLWLQRFVLGRSYTFSSNDITEHNIMEEMSLIGEDLPIGTMNCGLLHQETDTIHFGRRNPMRSYFKNGLVGTYFVDEAERQSMYRYRVRCLDVVDILNGTRFNGNMYANNLLQDTQNQQNNYVNALDNIGQLTGLDIILSDELSESRITGYIPICSCRQALSYIAFAICAVIDVDVDGKIHINKLADVVSSHIGADRSMQGVSVKENKFSVRDVRLSRWSYSLKTASDSTDPQPEKVSELIGSATPRRIETSSPYANWEAVFVGGTAPIDQSVQVISTTANHFEYVSTAVLSPGWILSAVPYVESEFVHTADNENSDSGAVSLTYNSCKLINEGNVDAVLEILAGNSKISEEVNATVILDNENVGDLVTIETDFGPRTGHIVSMNTRIANIRTAKVEVEVIA